MGKRRFLVCMYLDGQITIWEAIPTNFTCTNDGQKPIISLLFHEGPGSGSTHVPFGHNTAGMVKSPAWDRYVYCPKIVKGISPKETPNDAYCKSKEVG